MTSNPRPRSGRTLADYVQFVTRNVTVIVLGILVGLVAGFGYQHEEPKTFTSVSSMALTPVPTYIAHDPGQLSAAYMTIDTEAQIVRSGRVLLPIAKRLGEPVSLLQGRVSVTASPFSSVLHVAVSARTAALAQSSAETVAQRTLKVLGRVVEASQRNQVAQLYADISARERQLPGATNSIDPTKAQLLNAEIVTLRQRLRDVQATQHSVGHIIEAGALPQHAVGTNTSITLETGALIGLLLGLAAGAVRDRLRFRSWSPVVTKRRLLPITALVPTLGGAVRPLRTSALMHPTVFRELASRATLHRPAQPARAAGPSQPPPPWRQPNTRERGSRSRVTVVLAVAAVVVIATAGTLLLRDGGAGTPSTPVSTSPVVVKGQATMQTEFSVGPGGVVSALLHLDFSRPVRRLTLTAAAGSPSIEGVTFHPSVSTIQVLPYSGTPITVPNVLKSGDTVKVPLAEPTSRLDILYVTYHAAKRSESPGSAATWVLFTPLVVAPPTEGTNTLHINSARITTVLCSPAAGGSPQACGSSTGNAWTVTLPAHRHSGTTVIGELSGKP